MCCIHFFFVMSLDIWNHFWFFFFHHTDIFFKKQLSLFSRTPVWFVFLTVRFRSGPFLLIPQKTRWALSMPPGRTCCPLAPEKGSVCWTFPVQSHHCILCGSFIVLWGDTLRQCKHPRRNHPSMILDWFKYYYHGCQVVIFSFSHSFYSHWLAFNYKEGLSVCLIYL